MLRELREASVAYVWHMNWTTPQGKRAATLAAKRLMERSRDLWKLGEAAMRATSNGITK